jgi:stigma-specific protein Stig1
LLRSSSRGLLAAAALAGTTNCAGLVGGDFDGWAAATAPEGTADARAEAAVGLTGAEKDAEADAPREEEETPDGSSETVPESGPDGGPACPAGRTLCGSICVDPMTHDSHCGGCGKKCSTAQDCIGGQCEPTTTASLSGCYVTPMKCALVCASLGKACASTCGTTGTATALVYDKDDFDCSGTSYVRPDPNFCGYEFPSNIYGSMRCCCGSK